MNGAELCLPRVEFLECLYHPRTKKLRICINIDVSLYLDLP
jgi:hypothetical protein